MTDFRTTPDVQARGRSARSQRESRQIEIVTDLSQGMDIQHHDTSIRHTFGAAFEVPRTVTPTDPNDADGFVGLSDNVAREDHRHGYDVVPWTNVGSFSNGWGNFGAGTHPARYRRIGDIIYIEGTISGGTVGAGAAFTLPVGFRPTAALNFSVVSNNAFGRVSISSAGVVAMFTGNNTFFSLEGILFSTT